MEASTYEQFARDMKATRKRLHLSIPKLSDLSGVSATMLYYFEDGQRTLSDDLCKKVFAGIIKALEIKEAEEAREAERSAKAYEEKARKRAQEGQAIRKQLTQASLLIGQPIASSRLLGTSA